MITFVPASKSEARARVAMTGPSGSGKTYWALLWATELAQGGRIAFIDTERGSAKLYADEFTFDVLNFAPPFHPDKLIEAMHVAEDYAVLVVDSLSHFWNGPGGVLEIVDQAKGRFGGNSHAAWQVGTPIQQRMVDAILSHPGHVIAAMRAKTEWVMQEDARGRTVPVKLGLAPRQRDEIEFEFTIMLDIDLEHRANVGKTRCKSLADRRINPEDATAAAQEMRLWLGRGEPLADLSTRAAIDTARRRLTPLQKNELWQRWQEKALPAEPSMLTENQAAIAMSLIEAITETHDEPIDELPIGASVEDVPE